MRTALPLINTKNCDKNQTLFTTAIEIICGCVGDNKQETNRGGPPDTTIRDGEKAQSKKQPKNGKCNQFDESLCCVLLDEKTGLLWTSDISIIPVPDDSMLQKGREARRTKKEKKL